MHVSDILRPPVPHTDPATTISSSVVSSAKLSSIDDDKSERPWKDTLWEITWNTINQFCPKLKEEFIVMITGCVYSLAQTLLILS